MPGYDDDKICLCALNRIFGYEPRIATALLDYYGSPAAIFRKGKDELCTVLGPYSKYTGSLNDMALETAASELEEAERLGITFIGRGEKGYPRLLEECPDAPAGLYVKSLCPYSCMDDDREYISIVGTRNVSGYGKDWCRRMVYALARTGKRPVIVSGLAYGTDITAHLAALEAGLDTIAVMATGADSIYPALHRGHALRIASTGRSALVSDYPLHSPASALNFIRRNRIIAGIGKATVLVESRKKGGGMITARQAFSYYRDVYALPGRADDCMSEGCNMLIRSGSAIPVTSEEDFIRSLGFEFRESNADMEKTVLEHYRGMRDVHGTGDIARILLLIKKNRRISLQELAEGTGLDYSVVASLAGILENDGFISIDLMQRCSINRKNI